jgi:DNA replication protein DnaC
MQDDKRADGAAGEPLFDVQALVRDLAAKLEASPHRCRGGCGMHTLRENQSCDPCDEKRKREMWRHERFRQTLSTVPSRLKWATSLQAPELDARVAMPAALAKARAIDLAKVDRIVCQGPAGSGKSSIATATAMSFVRANSKEGMFVDAFELSIARRNSRLGSEADLVYKALKSDILILDDLGLEGMSQTGVVAEVIHRRHSKELPTIITTGFTSAAILAGYGDGLKRRVFEGACVIKTGDIQ